VKPPVKGSSIHPAMKPFAEAGIDEVSIIFQAERICSADGLKTKKLLCKFLSFIISESLAGREHQLKGYTIAIEVFGREKDFDSDNNALIRIHAGRLRRVLKAYYSNEGQFDEIIIEVPKGGYIPQFTLNTNSKIAEAPKQRIEKDLPKGPSIAILPFENQTGDSSKDYFVRGFSEELSVELTRYEDLIIYDCRETASELFTQYDIHPFITNNDIRFILEGAINFDSTNVKVLVRVTDRHDSKQLWAQSYLRALSVDNIITIRE
jgi:TolB-like protein